MNLNVETSDGCEMFDIVFGKKFGCIMRWERLPEA
jgi:hypothetical protein